MAYKIDEIEGIGAKYAERLQTAEIKSTDDLLKACSSRKGRDRQRKAEPDRRQIGGNGILAKVSPLLSKNPQAAGLLGRLDHDGDGNPLNDVMGMARNLFGKS